MARLPYSLKMLLENLMRNGEQEGAEAVAGWTARTSRQHQIAYPPARVLMQDFTGVPAIVDLAAMRDAMEELGGDATKINPLVAGGARDRPLDPGGRVRRAPRVSAQRRVRVRAQRGALRVPALGRRRPSTTSRWCRPTPASVTR